jgi:hypothetical protein
MKNLILVMSFVFIAFSAQADVTASIDGYSAKKVYKALDVEELQAKGPIEGSYYVKNVGGLNCSKTVTVNYIAKKTKTSTSYECELAQKNDAAAIYQVLKVKEVDANPGIVGAYKYEKTVGGTDKLKCSRSAVVVPNAVETVFCEFIIQE